MKEHVIFKNLASTMWAATIASTALPFRTLQDINERCNFLTFHGYNLWEISPTGSVVFISPLILLVILNCRTIRVEGKTFLWLLMVLFQVVAIPNAMLDLTNWATSNAMLQHTTFEIGLVFYIVFSLAAHVFTFLSLNNQTLQNDNIIGRCPLLDNPAEFHQ